MQRAISKQSPQDPRQINIFEFQQTAQILWHSRVERLAVAPRRSEEEIGDERGREAVFGVEHGDVDGECVRVEPFGLGEGEKFGPLVEGLWEGAAAAAAVDWGWVVVHGFFIYLS